MLLFESEPFFDGGWNKTADRAAQLRYLLDQARTQVGVGFRRHQEDCFHMRGKTSVHERHLKLIFVIGYCTDTSNNNGGLALIGEIDQEALESRHRDILQ